MPRMDGEELLKNLKENVNSIIFLTSKDDEVDELLGLKLELMISKNLEVFLQKF